MDRYRNEVNRLYGVLNRRLADHEYMAGDYSIADMASYPWIVPHERQGQKIADFPHIKRWLDAIKARPAVERAYAKAKEVNPNPGGIRTAEERAILFGQTAASVAKAAVRRLSAPRPEEPPKAASRRVAMVRTPRLAWRQSGLLSMTICCRARPTSHPSSKGSSARRSSAASSRSC